MNKKHKTYKCYFEFTGSGEYGIRAKNKVEAIRKCVNLIKKDRRKPDITICAEEVFEEEK